jgi:CheY-like chemotaxis protein
MKRLNLRIALVIEEADALRHAVVQLLRIQGWIVHGISRAEEALPIFRHIPYNLIVIDSEQSGLTATEFARNLQQSGKGQGIQLVAIIDSRGRSLGAELMQCGAFLARKSAWRDDISRFLANFEMPDSDWGPVVVPIAASPPSYSASRHS